MLKILDFNYNFVGATDEYLNPKRVSMLEKGDKELSFVIPSGLGINELIKEQYFVEFENDRYCIKEKKENIEGIGYICQLDIEGLLGEVFELIVGVNDDIPTLFNRIDISKSGWTIECDPYFTKRRTINLEYFDLWNLITEVIKVYACEIEIDSINRIIYFTEKVGNDNDVYFAEGLNIDETGIEIVSDSYELYTRIIPMGVGKVEITTVNGGKNYIDNFQYMDKVKTFYWKDERYTDLNILKEDATIRLNELSKPRNTINVTLKNLANISGEYEWLRVGVGDTITILSKGVKEKYRISELVEHPHSPFNDSITLNNTSANLSSYLQDRENDISRLDLSFEKITVETGAISSKVQKVEYDIKEQEKRIESAEEKITPDAIVHVVSSSVTNGESTFAKTSEMKQTIDGFEFKIANSGETSLIKNSLGKNGENGWYWFNYKGQTLTHSLTCQNDEWTGYEDALRIGVIETNFDIDQGYSQKIKVVPGKKYVFRAMVGGHRSAKRIVFTNEGNTEYISDSWTAGHMDGFDEVILKFTATEKFVNLRIGFHGSDSDAIIWLKEMCLIEGEIPSKWRPHSSEIYEGITAIDEDGVKVSMSNGEGLQGYSKTAYDGFSIYDSRGERKAWFGDGNSAYIQNLSADSITNRHLVKWAENRPQDLYISPNSSGDGTGRDTNNKSNSINHSLEWLRLTHGSYSYKKDIKIHIDNGVYNEDIYIGGWIGTGQILFYFDNGATWYGNHRIEESTMPVYIDGRRWNDGAWINEGCLFVKRGDLEAVWNVRSSFFYVKNTRSLKEGWSGGVDEWNGYGYTYVQTTCGSRVHLFNNDVVGFYTFVKGNDSSFISIYNNRGHCHDLANMYWGSLLQGQGNVPLYRTGVMCHQASNWEDKGNTGHNSLYQPKDQAPPPPVVSWQWFEQSFNLGNLRTRPEGGGSSTSSRNGEWGQGSWGGYQSHRGYADLGDDPGAWANGGRNFTVELTLTRSNTSHGYTGATPVPKIKLPNGTFWSCGVGFARGQTSTVTLPSELSNAIASGSVKTLEMWAGNSNNDYSFYNYSSIKIKCEKQV